jgi:hypothetical protein
LKNKINKLFLEFPLKTVKEEKIIIQKEKEIDFFENNENLIKFIEHVHGSYVNK